MDKLCKPRLALRIPKTRNPKIHRVAILTTFRKKALALSDRFSYNHAVRDEGREKSLFSSVSRFDQQAIDATTALTSEFRSLRYQLFTQHREALRITVLTEEFKTRWQQIVEWDDQVDKWTASYAIALTVGVSWILGSDRITRLDQFFTERNNDNSYFLLSLALVNAAYILYMTFKGYQIQQLRLYLYSNVCKSLNEIIKRESNSWETWHRRKGKSEWRRVLYYPVMTISPFAVSVFILWFYLHYVGVHIAWSDPHNIYFYFVIIIQVAGIILSISTTVFNRKWKRLIDAEGSKVISRNGETPDDLPPEPPLLSRPVDRSSITNPGATTPRPSPNLRGKDDAVRSTFSVTGISVLGFAVLLGSVILAVNEKLGSDTKE